MWYVQRMLDKPFLNPENALRVGESNLLAELFVVIAKIQ